MNGFVTAGRFCGGADGEEICFAGDEGDGSRAVD